MNFLKVLLTRPLVMRTRLVHNVRTVTQTASSAVPSTCEASSAAKFMGPFALGPPKPKLIPTPLDHVFLRWSGHFTAGDVIPKFIDGDVIHRARSLAVVRLNLLLIVATIVACGGMTMSGKSAASRGESLQQQNLNWHKRINDNYQLEQEATMPF